MAGSFVNCSNQMEVNGRRYDFFGLSEFESSIVDELPFSIRVLLECAVRNCDGFLVREDDVKNILNWKQMQHQSKEIPFMPSRVILQDFTGVPAVVDFAAMRDAVKRLGGDPSKVNPVCPADLVIDHSVQVDQFGSKSALKTNQEIELERNEERFRFLKWGSKAFNNMLIVPPGSGIVHQVNLEYLARVVFGCESSNVNAAGETVSQVLYPDSVVGTDSHTTMINGLGVLGWGVGGIEAEAVMLGQPIGMILPQVVGFKMSGQLPQLSTCTDLVLTVTKMLRDLGVVGKFVEFFGPGVAELSIADRATLSNMCPEYGATVGFFPVDDQTIDYLRQTGRDETKLPVIEQYLKANKLYRNYCDSKQDPIFTEVMELDLSTVVSCVSGPKLPQDQVPVTMLKSDFLSGLTAKPSFKGYGIKPDKTSEQAEFEYLGERYRIGHGSVVIAAITSCTNTSNPSVMIGAGLMAKNAVDKGLTVLPYVKTSLSPGSGVVTKYLEKSGLIPFLEKLGFYTAGYGCMTCIGNSGPLPDSVGQAIENNDLVVASVLSGNRNFEGRVHPLTRANYLASPPLVVAYALAGRVDIDFDKEPIGSSSDGSPVFLKDIFPTRRDIEKVVQANILPEMFREVYGSIQHGNSSWNSLEVAGEMLYPWDSASSYIKNPPFFADMERPMPQLSSVSDAFVLLNLGDFVTTDHISPAGSISRTSPAARFLGNLSITAKNFNTYGARRGNDAVMARGTFANIRIVNKFVSKPGPRTLYLPTGEEMDIYDAAMRYAEDGLSVIVLAGKGYGSGSSRDWAAKGPFLLGVKAVIAESYERIHRSNLIGMGIVPLQYKAGQTADSLGLSGRERYSINMPTDLVPGQTLTVQLDNGKQFEVISRFDTEVELTYYRNGGILQYMIRSMLNAEE